ncbi:hypothetical protein Dimus_018066 [Dionaea muscipula]
MQKIDSHTKNMGKMSKASKLAIQLVQAKSVKPETSAHFFVVLEAAMSSPATCLRPSIRADYQALSLQQKRINWLFGRLGQWWEMRAVVANDLFTDDSFVWWSQRLVAIPKAVIRRSGWQEMVTLAARGIRSRCL